MAPATYVKARRLPGKTLRLWLEEVAKSVQGGVVRTILDLGCGTGRFSVPLARRFHTNVIGVDPSAAMLAQARRGAPESVAFRRGSAERIPLKDGQADMVFMSQTWHHLRDGARAAREMRRVLAPNGLVCIRSSTIENIGSYLYMRFFPSARRSCLRCLPRRKEIVAVVTRAGFRLVGQRAVRQEFAPSPRAYLRKIRQKATYDLAELSDEEFALGFPRLARYCQTRDPDRAVSEQIDLFTFRPLVAWRDRSALHPPIHALQSAIVNRQFPGWLVGKGCPCNRDSNGQSNSEGNSGSNPPSNRESNGQSYGESNEDSNSDRSGQSDRWGNG